MTASTASAASSTPGLLIELLAEEMPPRALQKLGDAFAATIHARLQTLGLLEPTARPTAHATPRRLAVHIPGVLAQSPEQRLRHKLMPVSVGLDDAQQPTPALRKKLAALGLPDAGVDALEREGQGKHESLYLSTTRPGITLADGVQQALDAALAALPIPKLMRYQLADGWSSVQFVRPVHGLLVLHGSRVLDSVQALGHSARGHTFGHRFAGQPGPLPIGHADHYAEQLHAQGAVLVNFAARRAEIARQLEAAAGEVGLHVMPDAALLDEVTALVEQPRVLRCTFERAFLALPPECLILTMKANQKYFPLLDAAGTLSHHFLLVSNIAPPDTSAVVQGNERVVRARLRDAQFFFAQDRKTPLAARVAQLEKIIYHHQLGSQGARVQRVRAIARAIVQQLGQDQPLAARVDQAAQLAKADLSSDMVGEFPELQGIMGRHYALAEGLDTEVADAIEDHYRPKFSGDQLARGPVGTVLALADKLETLVGMFGTGNHPGGEKDPFALRRHALGLVRLLVEKQLPLRLDALLEAAWGTFAETLAGKEAPDARARLAAFIQERLVGSLRDQGYSAREIDAVLALGPQQLGEVPQRLEAVRAFARLEAAQALAAANKRVGNILKKSATPAGESIDAGLLREAAERHLHAALQDLAPQAQAQFRAGAYTQNLQTLAALRPAVDAFFDQVMVNAEEPALRANRLALLAALHRAMNQVADLARLAA